MSRLDTSLWDPANPPFVRDKCVTSTGKRLCTDYVQKAEVHTKNGTI